MNKYVILMPLLSGIISSAVADTPDLSVLEDGKQAELQQNWSCYTASDAQARKKQVEHGILPHVVFDGEIKSVNVESWMTISKTPALSVVACSKLAPSPSQ